MNKIAINREYCGMQGKDEVLTFILDFLSHSDNEENAENVLKHQFSNGYCYYFAVILKTAFNRGEVCWCAPYGHICWVDEDNVPYDIYGVSITEAEHFIPVSFLGKTLDIFLHTKESKLYITSQEEANSIIEKWLTHNEKPRLIKTWEELEGLENDKYKIVLNHPHRCSGFIIPKEETDETIQNHMNHHAYLSIYTFFPDQYKNSTQILQKFGFNVVIVSCEK